MNVDVSRLFQQLDERIQVGLVLTGDQLNLAGTQVEAVEGEVTVVGQIRHTGRAGILAFEGQITGTVVVPCSRCLTPVSLPLETTICVYCSTDALTENWSERQGYEDIVPEYPLVSHQLDIVTVARDALILAVPMQVHCQADCLGSCPICGQNLNESCCDCSSLVDQDARTSSPFDVLSQLFKPEV